MANQYMSMDTLRFLLYEVHQVSELFESGRFEDYDQAGTDMLLQSFKDFADQELFPYFKEMDEQPVKFEDGRVIVHPQLKKIYQKAVELGWVGASYDYEHGGMQLPSTLYSAIEQIIVAANNNPVGYMGLTTGAGKLIVNYGNQSLIDTYIPKMMEGKWSGTMALTEPQAGSSLSDITTTAYPTGEGYYKIKGQKIFISGGDQNFSENIVHLMLARIEGAPPGTKGISLFVVPKLRPTEEGDLEANDVTTAGDFQKMGQKSYSTVHLIMGEQNDCRGWLVGEPHQGLKYMFQMMNEARISVGVNATAMATAAYYASLEYARERPQGRRLTKAGKKDPASEQTLIIEHPDVKRMLLLQKSIVEGSLCLNLQSALYGDKHEISEGEKSHRYHLLLELMTPVCKTYPAEMGKVAIDNGLQVLGGYGFCSEYVLQQYYRDIRITSIYEGTTGIQSQDLLGRKLTIEKGRALELIAEEIKGTIARAGRHDTLQPYARQLGDKLKQTGEVIQHLMKYAKQGEYELFLADATLFMEFFSTVIVAWQWLKMSVVAKEKLLTGQGRFSGDFYESKIHTMKFYFKYELPKTQGLAQTLMDEEFLTISREKEVAL